jgi:hypothetical protein
MALSTVLFNSLLGFLGVGLLFRQLVDQAIGSLHSKENGNSPPDAGVSASDNGLLPLQLAGCFVYLVAAIFGRNLCGHRLLALHLRLKARLFLMRDRDLVTYQNKSGLFMFD